MKMISADHYQVQHKSWLGNIERIEDNGKMVWALVKVKRGCRQSIPHQDGAYETPEQAAERFFWAHH